MENQRPRKRPNPSRNLSRRAQTKSNGNWVVPRIWEGDTCVILGGGPSLRDFDAECLRPFRVIAVNSAFRLALWAEAMFFGDPRWIEEYGRGIENFSGLRVTIRHHYLRHAGIRVLAYDGSITGLSRDPAMLAWNGNSGAAAINLATLLGAGRLILLGFDMRRIEGRINYHSEYPEKGPGFDPFERFLSRFPAIAQDLEELGIPTVNATPFINGQPLSALGAFPCVPIEEAFC